MSADKWSRMFEELSVSQKTTTHAYIKAALAADTERRILALLVAPSALPQRQPASAMDLKRGHVQLEFWVDPYVELQEERAALLVLDWAVDGLRELPAEATVKDCIQNVLHLAAAIRIRAAVTTAEPR